jgi:hypothetical protein
MATMHALLACFADWNVIGATWFSDSKSGPVHQREAADSNAA